MSLEDKTWYAMYPPNTPVQMAVDSFRHKYQAEPKTIYKGGGGLYLGPIPEGKEDKPTPETQPKRL